MKSGERLKCLDALIASFGAADTGLARQGGTGLLLEHLQVARRGLLGAMTGEFKLGVEQAADSVSCIPDKRRAGEVTRILHSLLA